MDENKKLSKKQTTLIVIGVFLALGIIGSFFEEKGNEQTVIRENEQTAIEIFKKSKFKVKPGISVNEKKLVKYKGMTISGDELMDVVVGNIPENLRYGYETKSNPVGSGTLVAFTTWSSTTDSTKKCRSIWLIDGNKVKAGNLTTAMYGDYLDPVMEATDGTLWPIFEKVFI